MKMKKLMIAFLCCLPLIGCGNHQETSEISEPIESELEGHTYVEVDGKEVDTVDIGGGFDIEQLPYNEIRLNDENFSLMSVGLYQAQSSSGYGYFPYVTVEFDLSVLSDKNRYWLLKEKDYIFGMLVQIDSEKNDLEDKDLSELASWTTSENKYFCVYTLGDEYKYDFSDMSVEITFDIEQDETYEYENDEGEIKKNNKRYWYILDINKGDENMAISVLDLSEMPREVLEYFRD